MEEPRSRNGQLVGDRMGTRYWVESCWVWEIVRSSRDGAWVILDSVEG